MALRTEPLGDVANEFVFDNDRVKVWHLVLEPGQSSAWHVHGMDYITIVIDPGTLLREWEDGTEEELVNPVGRINYTKTHGAHRVTNIGNATYRNALIELK